MITRLSGRKNSARSVLDRASSPITPVQSLSICCLLLKNSILSRGNCGCCPGTASQINFRPPRSQRRERDIEKTSLKHEQEWHRKELAVDNGKTDEIGEVNGEPELGDG